MGDVYNNGANVTSHDVRIPDSLPLGDSFVRRVWLVKRNSAPAERGLRQSVELITGAGAEPLQTFHC